MSNRLLAVLMASALIGLSACDNSPAAPTESGPLTITPASATLAVGQSQIFEVRGGRQPITVQVIGCLGRATSCVLYNLADGHVGDVGAPFTLERLDAHLVRVMFREATLQPVLVRVEAFEGSGSPGTQAYANLVLVY